jgi:hypothetical protein
MAEMPRATDLFGDVSPVEAAQRHEDYLATLDKALSNASSTPGVAPKADPLSAMESLAANKSLAPDAMAGLQNALAAQRVAMQDIQKEITLTTPLSSSFAAFDLEAPAKMLTPRPTPLRNRIPRKKGVGTSHRVKRILGYTGTGTGGVGNLWPGITETTTNTFGGLTLERGPQISYAADDLVLPYNSYSLSDSVSFDANFSGLGYQDLRQLSSTSTLYATMLMEERMMLFARGTASGYSGTIAAPTFTVTSPAAGTGETGFSAGAAGTYYINVTSDAGISGNGFGESILGVEASTAVASGDVIKVTVSTAVAGALGYNIYVGAATGAANLTYQGTLKGTGTFTINAAGTSGLTGNSVAYTTTGAAASRASTNTSAYATGYDGILPTVLNPAISGAINSINSTFSTANPGVEFQNVFATMYANVKADPDLVLLNGNDRKQLSDAIKSGSTANYRLTIQEPGRDGVTYGSIVTGLQNEVTGKAVDLMVHPWLNQGVAPVLSFTLPIPDTEVSDVWANFMVQDYMGIQWPVVQFTYDFSTYFRGTFFCTAPAWNGVVNGIVPA